jgi:hypothetical protein
MTAKYPLLVKTSDNTWGWGTWNDAVFTSGKCVVARALHHPVGNPESAANATNLGRFLSYDETLAVHHADKDIATVVDVLIIYQLAKQMGVEE